MFNSVKSMLSVMIPSIIVALFVGLLFVNFMSDIFTHFNTMLSGALK